MFRIILTLGFTLFFVYAQTCDFSDFTQDECEIDIENPPLMLHKFVNSDGSEFSELQACVATEDMEVDGVPYNVLDCSMVETKKGDLTEGVTIGNGKNLIKNRVITIKQDNVLMRVAGDFVIDSGIRLNTKNTKNFIVEVIEGTNTKSNLILQRGAALTAKSIFMPEGANSTIFMNTFYGGIYEKEFIDIINKNSARGDMETILAVDNISALSNEGGDDEGGIVEFDGNIVCGPEVNPLDLDNKEYVLKRLFRVKNTSIDAPNENNAVCDVKEGGCFENLIEFGNKKFDGKSYKIAAARAQIIPTYDIFIESGKIVSSDNKSLKDIAPSAKINKQNYGACGIPAKIAFDKSVVDAYLADLEATKAAQDKKVAIADSNAVDSADSTDGEDFEDFDDEIAQNSNLDSAKNADSATDSATDSTIDSAPKIAESKNAESDATESSTAESAPTQSEIASAESNEQNAQLEENLQDLLETFKGKKLAEKGAKSAIDSTPSAKDSTPSTKGTESKTAESAPTPSAKGTESKTQESTQNAKIAESKTPESAALTILKDATPKEQLEINDEFLIVESGAYDEFNKSCYGDLQCIYNELLPFDKVVWNKKSSQNTTHKIFVLNVSDDNLSLKCEVRGLYGKTLKQSFDLSATNTIGIIDLKFPSSSTNAQITCKGAKQEKSTNKIIVTPASFDIDYNFADAKTNEIPTLKAGNIKVDFKGGRALTMEGEVDYGFSQNLAISDISFIQKDYCANGEMMKIPAPKDLRLNFKKGYLRNASMDIEARVVALGDLKIDFAIPNNDSTCAIPNTDGTRIANDLKPTCTTANITKEVSIIPANFGIYTKIESKSKISYYGQLDDKLTFRGNPLLNLKIVALDNTKPTPKPIKVNQSCGIVELELENDKLIEFKRTSSDRLNSKITAYLRDFEKADSTNIKVYFGINKLIDEYRNSRTMRQNDLLEPVEITTTDLLFNIRFKNGKSQFVYDNLDIYDDAINEVLTSVLIARGKLQVNDIKGDTRNPPALIAKYAIYCKSCDKAMLAKYLQGEPEVESQYWYINNQHINDFYIRNKFMNTRVIKANGTEKAEKASDGTQNANGAEENYTIKNSQTALEGRQKITFESKKSGIYAVHIDQRTGEFAPYLNYSADYKNSYVANSFKVMIAQNRQDILDEIKKAEEAKIAEEEAKKAQEEAKRAQEEAKKAKSKPKQTKSATKSPSKPAKPAKPVSKAGETKKDSGVRLDIED